MFVSTLYASLPPQPKVPALFPRPEFAVGGAAGVVAEVQKPGVTLLSVLHARVPTHAAVPHTEARGRLGPESLQDGHLTTVGEQLCACGIKTTKSLMRYIPTSSTSVGQV